MRESTTYLKNISISPKKLRFYLGSVKKMSPVQALTVLFYGKQKATRILYQALKSAMANAKQTLKVDENLLKFKVFTVEEGQKLKRYKPGSRGSAKPILRRKSHIKIVLVAEEINKPKLKQEKKENIIEKSAKKEVVKKEVKNSKQKTQVKKQKKN